MSSEIVKLKKKSRVTIFKYLTKRFYSRQHIAVCAAADYFARSGGKHDDKLGLYFVSLVKSIPKLNWNLSKNQVCQVVSVEVDFGFQYDRLARLKGSQFCRA